MKTQLQKPPFGEPVCPVHLTPLVCTRCLGASGGRSRSAAKLAAAERNRRKALKAKRAQQ